MRIRKWLFPTMAALGAGIMGLALIELGLRLTGVASPPAVLSVNVHEAERIPGVFVPRRTVRDLKDPRFPHLITINSLGYRGRELTRNKKSGTTRIFFAGDSFTWGDLVDDHHTVPARLEEHARPFCPDTEVINAGVGGTTIDGQQEMVRRGLELDPDLVVLMFYDNDLADLEPPTFWDLMMDNRRRKSVFPLSLVSATLNRTALWAILRRVSARLSAQPEGVTSGEINGPHSRVDRLESLKESYKGRLLALAEELDTRRIPLVLVGFPAHLTLLDTATTSNHLPWLSALAEEAAIPFVNLLPPLRDAVVPTEDLYFLPWDGHPRPLAYDIAAQELAAELRLLQSRLSWCVAPMSIFERVAPASP